MVFAICWHESATGARLCLSLFFLSSTYIEFNFLLLFLFFNFYWRLVVSQRCVKLRCTTIQFSSVQFSSSVMSDSATAWAQHTRLPCPPPSLGACSNSCPLSQWCHPTISSSVIPFSPHLQSFLVSEYFPMSQFFASGGHCIGVSASTSVLSMNT